MPAVQARHAAPLLPATPAADIPGVDAADDTRPPLGLPCEPATRRLGSAAPTGCETCGMFDGSILVGSFNTRACPRTRVGDIFSCSKKRSDEACSQTGL